MWLFAIFVAVPLIEIALFIQLGGFLGLWPTLLIVVLTAMLGTALVRRQGALALGQIKGSIERFNDPTEPLAHGAMILVAGALLLTPGFFTDAVGFLLLLPPFRRRALTWAKAQLAKRQRDGRAHFEMHMGGDPRGARGPAGPGAKPQGDPRRAKPRDTIIETDYQDVTPAKNPTHRPSGWTKH